VEYGDYFALIQVRLEWLEKAANQNNPQAMDWLGVWFRYEGNDKEKAVSYHRAAARLGWERAMISFARMLRDGEGYAKDLRQEVIWGAKSSSYEFGVILQGVRLEVQKKGDCNQLCYSLGWGLFWYKYEMGRWKYQSDRNQVFGSRCLVYYCSCVELQQKSIFTFLLCWNRVTGVKGPGQIIAQMVWEQREDNLVVSFEGKEPESRSE
jgi:hypothetical protein